MQAHAAMCCPCLPLACPAFRAHACTFPCCQAGLLPSADPRLHAKTSAHRPMRLPGPQAQAWVQEEGVGEVQEQLQLAQQQPPLPLQQPPQQRQACSGRGQRAARAQRGPDALPQPERPPALLNFVQNRQIIRSYVFAGPMQTRPAFAIDFSTHRCPPHGSEQQQCWRRPWAAWGQCSGPQGAAGRW